MDAQKRQKVILVVVSVLALGAGSYWYLGGESGESKSAVLNEGPVVRRERAAKEAPTTRRRTDAKPATREEPRTVERREREAPDETTVERKKRREDKTKEKKKALAPAA